MQGNVVGLNEVESRFCWLQSIEPLLKKKSYESENNSHLQKLCSIIDGI